MAKNSTRLNEFEIISRYFAPLAAGEPGSQNLENDAAVIGISRGHHLVVTTDTIISGVHFLATDSPEAIASKLLGVNLSDLAAMGARPTAYTLSLALPLEWIADQLEDWLKRFTDRLAIEQAATGINLIGGDTVATPGPLCLTATAFGEVEKGMELRRSAARPGDVIYVSGTIGDAALYLKAITEGLTGVTGDHIADLERRYYFPQPRVQLGRRLLQVANGVADVSDGLIADIGHVCRASAVTATVKSAKVPLSAAGAAVISQNPELLLVALTGGDDYELVFTAPAEAESALDTISLELDLPLTRIGRVTPANLETERGKVHLVDPDGRPIELDFFGYRHF